MPTPACVHVYGGPKIYINYRNSGGSWTPSQEYGSTDYLGTSTGILTTAYPNKRGVVSRDRGGTVYWLGDGLPDDKLPIVISNSIAGDAAPVLPVYWEAACGAWWINDAWYVFLTIHGIASYRYALLKSTAYEGGDVDRPNLWEEINQANTPRSSEDSAIWLRWDGISDTFNIMMATGTHIYSLYEYNFTTDTWSAPYGVLDPGFWIFATAPRGTCGNGIYKYPNGDIGLIYSRTFFGTYYRLYFAATNSWGASILVKNNYEYVGTVVPDPSRESLHIFTIDYNVTPARGVYNIVSHAGVIQTNLFTWPSYVSPDYFGNGAVYQNQLFVPYDDESNNMVWVAPITGGATTFTASILDRPVGELETPSCASMFYIPLDSPELLESLGDQLILSDAILARLSGGDLSIKPFIDGCPEIIVASEYCTSWKPWKTNTLQEVNGCDDKAFSSVPPTQCE